MGEQVVIVDARMQGRSRRRRTALMARIFMTSLVAAVGLGLALAALVAFTRVKQVTVLSSDPALAQEVSQGLQVPPWANLVTSKLSYIAAEAEQFPRVKSAQFERRFPDRLIVTVEPREPRLAFEKDGRFLLVDDEGACTEWTKRPDKGLLRVRGMGVKAEVGQRLTGEWFERSLTVARALADAGQYAPWTLDAHYPPELSIITGTGARGILGHCEDVERRVELFVEALGQYGKRGQPIGLMELRTDKPIVWTEEHRPDKAAAGQP